jgi:hypothetical protein
MPSFCVNKNAQPTGEHEVHNIDAGCSYLPDYHNQQQLGAFTSCHGAIAEARKIYTNVDGCAYCAPSCHTK